MGYVKATAGLATNRGLPAIGVGVQFRQRVNTRFFGLRPTARTWRQAGIEDPREERFDVYIDDSRARIRIVQAEEGHFRTSAQGSIYVTVSNRELYPFINTANTGNRTHRAPMDTLKITKGCIEFDVPGELWE